MKKILLSATILVAIATASEHKVNYPEGYRNWTHLKSMVINDAHSLANPFEGIHHIYGNKKALDGISKNNYKNGATFVFDLLEAKRSNEAIEEGKRKFIGVMEYDSSKYKKTGNWGFEAFGGDSKTQKVVNDAGVSCFACHTAVESKGFVFSGYRK